MKMTLGTSVVDSVGDCKIKLELLESIRVEAHEGMEIVLTSVKNTLNFDEDYYLITIKKQGEEIGRLFIEKKRFYLMSDFRIVEFNKDASTPDNRLVVYDEKDSKMLLS